MADEGSEYIDAYMPAAPKEAGSDYTDSDDAKNEGKVTKVDKNGQDHYELTHGDINMTVTGEDFASIKDMKQMISVYKDNEKKGSKSNDYSLPEGVDYQSLKDMKQMIDVYKQKNKKPASRAGKMINVYKQMNKKPASRAGKIEKTKEGSDYVDITYEDDSMRLNMADYASLKDMKQQLGVYKDKQKKADKSKDYSLNEEENQSLQDLEKKMEEFKKEHKVPKESGTDYSETNSKGKKGKKHDRKAMKKKSGKDYLFMSYESATLSPEDEAKEAKETNKARKANKEEGQDYNSESPSSPTENETDDSKKNLDEEMKDIKDKLDFYKEKQKKAAGSENHAFTSEDFKALKLLRKRVEEFKENKQKDKEPAEGTEAETQNDDVSGGDDYSQQLLPNKVGEDGAIVPQGDEPHAPDADPDCNNYTSTCICHCEKGDAGAKKACLDGC